MSRLVKIVNNKYVQIEEYKNPNICFNTNEYDNFEDYCTLRETFDPFEIFYENQELKKQLEEYKEVIDKAIEYINKYAWQEDIIGGIYTTNGKPATDRYMKLEWDNCNELLDILKEVK